MGGARCKHPNASWSAYFHKTTLLEISLSQMAAQQMTMLGPKYCGESDDGRPSRFSGRRKWRKEGQQMSQPGESHTPSTYP